jgi:DNA-binding NarL/FixJ family response regulator
MVRTYLIEPQLLFVPYLTRVLADVGLHVIATSDDVDGKDIALHDPAAIFVDVDFFERGAPNAICRIRQVAKHAAVIAFSELDDPTFEAACYISGASALVSKRAGVDIALKKVRGLLGIVATPTRSVSA